MRRSTTSIAAVLLTASSQLAAAAPFFGNGASSTTTAAPAAPDASSGHTWGMGKWWGSSSSPNPQAFPTQSWQQPAKPSISTRVSQAFTDNPIARAMKTAAPEPYKAQPVHDSLSLTRDSVPPSTQLIVAGAQMSERQGNLAETRRMLQQAVIQGPNDLGALRAAAHFEDRQQQFGAAEHLYRRAMATSGGEASTLNDLALCVARQGRFAESRALFEQAIAKNPTKPLYRNNLATLLVEMGDEPAALAQLQSVHAPATAQYNLGQLLARAGKTDQAASYLAAAATLDPTLAANVQPSAPAVESPLTDPRGSQVSESLPWTSTPVNSPVMSASEPWTPAPAAAPMGLPATESRSAVAAQAGIDSSGPKLLPPVR